MISLFLDLDGTLIDLAAHPEEVTVPNRLPVLLAGLEQKLHGALAMATGRNIATLDGLLAPYQGPAIGVHGAECRLPGGNGIYRQEPLPPALQTTIIGIAKSFPPAFIEDKGAAVAVHFQGEAAQAAQLQAQLAAACLRHGPQWRCLAGHRVIEVKPATTGKGDGLARMMGSAPFAGTAPVAIGDDITDLDLFSAARTHGGLSISVGDRIAGAGDWHLPSPAAVMGLLERCLAESSVNRIDAIAVMAANAGAVRTSRPGTG